MEAPTPVDNGGSYLRQFGCPLCHRSPIDPRSANCGHTYCLLCLRDVHVTAALFGHRSLCNLCHADISDPLAVAYAPHRVLPQPVADSRPSSQAPTVKDAFSAMHHQRPVDPRNYYYASGPAYQSHPLPQSMLPPPHQLHQMPRYDGSHGRIPSSDEVVNTIESSPRASTVSVKSSENQEDIVPVKNSLKNLAFHLKGDLELDDEAHQIIEQNGGRITTGATKNTDYVVMGSGAKKTKAMEKNGGVILDEDGFWKLMHEKIGDMHEQFHGLHDEERKLTNEENKLKQELARLDRKTASIKHKLEELEEAKAGIKKQKLEDAALLEVSKFVEKSED
jgi:hypothetical protein